MWKVVGRLHDDGQMKRSANVATKKETKQNLELVRKAQGILRSWSRTSARAELNEDFTFVNYQIHRKAVLIPPFTNDSDEDDFDSGSS